MANAQLALISSHRTWTLSEDTRRIGRAGLAQARAILAQAPEPTGLVPQAVLSACFLEPAAVQPSVAVEEAPPAKKAASSSTQLHLIAA